MTQMPGGNTTFQGYELPGAQAGLALQQMQSLKAQDALKKQLFAQLFGSKGTGGLFQGIFGGGGTGGGGTGGDSTGGAFVGGPAIGNLLGQLSGYGKGERARIEQSFKDVGNTALARLEQRGLGASSLVAPTLTGVEKEKQLSLGELGDRLIGQRIGVQERGLDRSTDLVSKLLGGIF